MLGISAAPAQSPVLGTQSLGQQARQHILRMPRAPPSHAKRHHGARSSDLSSVSSAASSSPGNGHASGGPSALPAPAHRRSHNPRSHKTNANANAGQAPLANNVSGSCIPHGSLPARDAPFANGHALSSCVPSSGHFHASNGFNHAKHPVHHGVANAPGHRRDSVGSSSVSSSSVAESFTSQSSIHISDDSHRRIDITMKNPEIHRDPGQPGSLGLALTVVGLCPAYDTIAILVLLMQLSGFFLSLVYMLFTFLTFVPPATSTGFNSLSVATVKEVLQESTFSLSYLTVFLVDSVIFLLWLFLWEPAQNVVLDLAKMVIALTLGGGVNSRGGGWRGILGCLGVIAYSHFSHRTRFTLSLKKMLPTWWMDTESRHDFSGATAAFPELSVSGKIGRVIIQLLAIHIFSQGIMRYVRDWLLRSQKRESQSHSIQDPEAGKLFYEPSSIDAISAAPDVEGSSPAAPGSSQPAPTAASARKKRKQSTQVRLMQPLWAAIASTKIVMKKEMELSGQKELGGKSSEHGDMVSAPFHAQEGQIWLSDVDSEEAFFATSYFPDVPPAEEPVIDARHPDSSSLIDSTKPFYVRINNAIWPSMQMQPVEEDEGHGDGIKWTGGIPGLPAGSNFLCEFISTHTGEVIFSTSFRTRAASTNDADIIASPAQTPRTQRPESPVTTLKSSIKSLESKLADEKNRLKTIKRDNQAKIRSQKKELERLAASIQSSGNNDAKYRQKIQSNAHLKQQYEEQAAQHDADLQELRRGNKSIVKCKNEAESVFNHEKDKFTKAQSEFKAFKAELDASIHALESESTTLQNKRNKVATRLAKLDADLCIQEYTNSEGLNEAERRRREEQAWEADLARVENMMQDRIRSQHAKNEQLERQIQGIVNTMSTGQYYAQPYGIREEIEPSAQSMDQGSSTKLNPAAPHYNPGNQVSSAAAAWPPMLNAPPKAFNANPWSNAGVPGTRSSLGSIAVGSGAPRPRGRSSSMLSTVSGLTHFSDGDTVAADASTATATPAMAYAMPTTTKTMSPPPSFVQPSPPGFSQPSPTGLGRLPPGLHQLRRSDTVGSGGSKSSGGGSP